jgi:uncharacterized protein YceK
MFRPFFIVAILGIVLAVSGCGTLCSLVTDNDKDKRYGGIQFDMQALASNLHESDLSSLVQTGDGTAALIMMGVVMAIMAAPAIDFPISFVGDTLLYPVTQVMDGK